MLNFPYLPAGGSNDYPGVVTFANGTNEQIVAMIQAADEGKLNLSDYWAVGDERPLYISAIEAVPSTNNPSTNMEVQAAQLPTIVLMHEVSSDDTYVYVDIENKKVNYIVGFKDCLATKGKYNTVAGSASVPVHWQESDRRYWFNESLYNAVVSSFKPVIKKFKTKYYSYSQSGFLYSEDYFALPAEKEILGTSTYSSTIEAAGLTQFDYYKTTANRVKKVGSSSSQYWTRSIRDSSKANECYIGTGGASSSTSITTAYGISPFFCI